METVNTRPDLIAVQRPSTGPSTTGGISVSHLTVSYQRRGQLLRVLSNVSLDIKRGESYGLVGESGCGKTTVAMAIMRYLPPNAVVESGRIEFGGLDLLSMSDGQLRELRGNRMAMVYQDPGSALNPSMRIGDQIAEVYRYHKGLGKRAGWDAALLMLDLVRISNGKNVLGRYPHQLSGGQQQRVMLAMALATDPELLVLDEPTTGLDATVQAEVLDLVEELRDKVHASILLITHNLGTVARVCERVGVLYAGRIVEEGLVETVFANPRHPYTLGLLRCVPQVDTPKGAVLRLDPIPGSLPALGQKVQGCSYAERCPIAREVCDREEPPIHRASEHHLSRCFFPDKVIGLATSRAGSPKRLVDEAPSDISNNHPMLAVDHLVKTYQSKGLRISAVDDVSLEVFRGEVFGLAGESGSGKSTLAGCIVGLIKPTAGRIQFDGKVLSATVRERSAEMRHKMQMMFQNPDSALNPSHSIRYIIERSLKLVGGIRTRAELDTRIEELANSVRLHLHDLDARPASLSGGMKQRAAIARALAGSPALVVCDEPTSALDVSVQAAILTLLVELRKEKNLSYVVISHDLGVLRYLANRIGVMYLGQIVEVGTAEAIFDRPRHPYTDALLSAVPSLHGKARHARAKAAAVQGPGPTGPGCRFHNRCPLALGDLCSTVSPPWQHQGSHQYRCHIAPTELLKIQVGMDVPKSQQRGEKLGTVSDTLGS